MQLLYYLPRHNVLPQGRLVYYCMHLLCERNFLTICVDGSVGSRKRDSGLDSLPRGLWVAPEGGGAPEGVEWSGDLLSRRGTSSEMPPPVDGMEGREGGEGGRKGWRGGREGGREGGMDGGEGGEGGREGGREVKDYTENGWLDCVLTCGHGDKLFITLCRLVAL